MSESTNVHPGFSEILSLLDGERAEGGEAVEVHVRECRVCQRQMEECRAALAAYGRYEEAMLGTLPEEPHPWLDLRAAFHESNTALSHQRPTARQKGRIRSWLAGRARRILAGGGAAGCLAFALVLVRHFDPGTARELPPEEIAAPGLPQTPPPSAPHLDLRPAARSRPHPAVDAAPSAVESPLNIEVRVFAVLHGLGADLGEPVEVTTRADGRVVVGGAGLTPERQAEIRQSLSAEPRVIVDFAGVPPTALPEEMRQVAADQGSFRARILDFAGSQAAYEKFADHLLDESEQALSRAHALDTLARRFPAERQSEMEEQERLTLRQMTDAHSARFQQHAATLLALVDRLSAALVIPPPQTTGSATPLESAKRLDRILSVLVGGAATDLSTDQVLTELSNASAALRTAARDLP